MALKQQQELKQTQRLSPLQMQVIKLIELNNVEVEDRIKQEIEENPALETTENESINSTEGDEEISGDNELTQEDMILGDYFSDDDVPDYRLNVSHRKNEPDYIEISYYDDKSLHDFLQIGRASCRERV